MIDQVLLQILVFLLTVAPPEQPEIRVDLGELRAGKVQSMLATRNQEGFTVRDAAGGDQVMEFRRAEEGVYELTMGGDELEIDIRPLTGSLAPLDRNPTQSLEVGGEKIAVCKVEDLIYVFSKGERTFLVAHVTGATSRLRGELTHKEVDETVMSVEAYLGDEFYLAEEGGKRTVLQPSTLVTRETLLALSGKRVEVIGAMVEGKPPRPEEAAPMGDDGKPMKRGAGFEVRSINVLPGGDK